MGTAVSVGERPADRSSVAAQVVVPSGHRAHLDGLRAVAVYLVVLFHAGINRFAGGYVGVDVFFVLSGYLVTEVLIRDVAAEGSVRFGRFYARRFRRLLPAAFVALIGTAAIIVALDPAEALASLDAFKAAFLYVANWYFIRESTDYFAAEVATNPVLPFWSLAVEEQFYVIWPLTLAAVFWVARRVRRHQLRFVRLVIAAGALASVSWALWLRTDAPNRAYFGTDARAYQLLAGASIALVPGAIASIGRFGRGVRVAAVAAVVGIVALGTSVGVDDPIVRGIAVTVVTVAAIVALEAADGGVARWCLSSPPMVYLGRISYGTYLWHWPVIIVASVGLDLGEKETLVAACLVATGLASLSYQVLEQPVRTSSLLDRHRLVVIATGLAISVIAALVIVPAIVEPRGPATVARASPGAGLTPVPDWVDTAQIYVDGYGGYLTAAGKDLTCVDAAPEACTIVAGSGPRVLLMGDSNMQMLVPAFMAVAEQNDLSLVLASMSGCPWQREVYALTPEIQAACRSIKVDAYDRVIPALDPDVIVVMNAGDPRDLGAASPEDTHVSEAVEASTRSSLDELATDGRTVVVIEPIPLAPGDLDPLACLSDAEVLEDCRYVATPGPSSYELLTRELAAANPRVRSVDLDPLVCPYLPICDPIVDGVVVKWNNQHLTKRFGESLATPIATYLRDEGLI